MFPVDAFRNTLANAVAIFERHTIRFHLTGGLTSVLYGEPRMTQDSISSRITVPCRRTSTRFSSHWPSLTFCLLPFGSVGDFQKLCNNH